MQDWGGLIGSQVALRTPDRVKRLVHMDSFVRPPGFLPEGTKAADVPGVTGWFELVLDDDFDEVILPHQHDSIPDMLAHLRSTWQDEPPAFIFRNAYFFLDSPPAATSKEEALMTSKFTARQDVSEFGYSSKSITNPRRCSVVQNHYCMERAPDVSSRWYLSVDAAVGLNHHYKMCHFESVVCERLVRKTTVDTSALRFRGRLVKAVRSTLKELATRS